MNIQRSTSSLMWVYCRQPDARSSSLGTSREFSRKKVPWYTSCVTNDCAILAQTAVSEVITCLIEMMKNNPFGNAHASLRDTCYLAYLCICFHVCHCMSWYVSMSQLCELWMTMVISFLQKSEITCIMLKPMHLNFDIFAGQGYPNCKKILWNQTWPHE